MVAQLGRGLNKSLQGEALAGRLAELGAEVKRSTPEQANRLVQDEVKRWAKVVDEVEIKAN